MTMLYYKVTTRDDELLAVGKDRGQGMIIYDQGAFVMSTVLAEWINKKLKTDTYSWKWKFLNQVEFETYQAFGIKEIKIP